MNTIDDFCTNPGGANWIGLVKNKEDEVIPPCSACHAGLGEKPSETMTQAQLENIDCLQCHASGYRRDV